VLQSAAWFKNGQTRATFPVPRFRGPLDIAAMQPLMERELAGRAQITMLAATAHTGDAVESEAGG
jgi:hypothetical protein